MTQVGQTAHSRTWEDERDRSSPNDSPTIAVVTVCRNALAALRVTVDSVQSLTYPRVAHIVVDGASSDGTLTYLRESRGLFYAMVSEPDKGIYDAMNKAIDLCPDHAWMIFMNAGDRFASPDVLESVIPSLRTNVALVFGDVAIRNIRGRSRIIEGRPHATVEMPGCHQSLLTRSEVMRRLRFDTTYRVGSDYDFYLRARNRRLGIGHHVGVIAEIAPEGFSADNEDVLRADYVRSISCHLGGAIAAQWLRQRKVRFVLLCCRDLLRRAMSL